MGAGYSCAGQPDGADAGIDSDTESDPPPKKVFLKVKIVSARGLHGHDSGGLYCACKIPGRRTDLQTRPATASAEPEWRHQTDKIEDYETGDSLLFELYPSSKRRSAPEEGGAAEAPLGTAFLASESFHRGGFSGELELQGELMAQDARLSVKVVVGTRKAVRDHTTRSQVLLGALKKIEEGGVDSVEALEREVYLAQNKALSKDLRAALKGKRYGELKQAYAEFRQCVEQARSRPAGSSSPAMSAVVEAHAETLLRRLAPAAGVIGQEGAASLLQQLVVLLPEEPQRHAFHQALQGLQKEEEESAATAEVLLAAGEEAAAAEEAAGTSEAAVATGAAVAVGAAAVGVGAAAAMEEKAEDKSRVGLLEGALREVEGEKIDEADSLSPEALSQRNKGLKTGMRSIFGSDRYSVFKGHYGKFEESVREIRPTDPPEAAEQKRTAAAAVFAGQSRDLFGEAADTVGEDAAAPLLGQMVQMVPDREARHALRKELSELHRQEAGAAGALALPEEEKPAEEASGASQGGLLAALGLAGVGAAAAAWWATRPAQAEPEPPAEPQPAPEPAEPPPPVEALAPQEPLRQGDPGKVRVAQALSSLGTAYKSVGKLEEALDQNKKALSVKQETLGDEHPDTAVSYNNVAAIYRLKGDLPNAYENYTKALEIRRRTLGDLSHDTAMSHTSVGAVLLQRGAVDEALEHYSRALEITRAVHGDQHPETAARYNDVGAALEQKGDLEKALEHLWNALNIQTETLGDQNTGVGDSYNNVGAVLWQLGRLEEALEFHSRALEIRLAVLGEGNSDTALSYGNVGVILEQQGRLAEAVEHQRKALQIRSTVLGPQHSETAASHVNVAIALERQGHYTAALDHFRDANRILNSSMGRNHPWTKQAALHLQRCEKAAKRAAR